MHQQLSGGRTVRSTVGSILIVLFAAVVVLTFAPTASAQMGMGGAGSGAGGGGGSKGSGSRGSAEKKPRPKRHEIPPVDPSAAREKLQSALTIAFTRGSATTPYLSNLFDQASTGAVPASAQSRKALAEALSSALKGQKLDQGAAGAIAEPVAAMVNIDGIEPDEVAAKKDPLKESLGAAGLTEEQVLAAVEAAERLVAEQQDETVKQVMDVLDEIQKEGEAGEDRKQSLAERITGLAPEGASPDEAAVTKLAEHLTKGLDSAQLTTKERAQLTWNIRAVLHSADLPPAQFQPMLNEVRSILKAGLVKQADVQAIATDLQSIHKSFNGTAPAQGGAAPAAGQGN